MQVHGRPQILIIMQVHIDNEHQYDLEKTERKVIVKYSGNEWTKNGDTCCVLYDDGDGITIALDSTEFDLSYYEADILLSALIAHTECSFQLVKTETIKSL